MQETRLWDPEEGITVLMRSKEEAHDYRYFPEPDLVPVQIPVDWVEEIRKTLPELPEAKRERFIREYGLPEYDAEVLTAEKRIADYFESCARKYKNYKNLSNWISTELLRELKVEGNEVSSEYMVSLLNLMDQGIINRNTGKKVFEEMCKSGKPPEEIVEEQGLTQLSDEQMIEQLIGEVLTANPNELKAYRQGKEKLFGFFVGQVMKLSGGKANPGKVNKLLKKKLAIR